MTIKKKQAAIYGRKSREGAATLESQINACKEWAEKNGIEVEIFAEEGTQSSEDWNRPKLQEMLKKIENMEYDYVIVSEQTRISRNEDFGQFKKKMKETGTIFVLADTNETINYLNRNDAVKSGIQQVFGEYELDIAKTRLKRGTIQSAKKGNWVAKKSPIGYEYDKETKRLKKTNDAEVVKLMFDLYINGASTVEITHKFNHENINAYHKVKGTMIAVNWSKSTVARMLQNIAYIGHTLYGKTKVKKISGKKQQINNEEDQQILIKDTHEPIITNEVWEKTQTLLKKRRVQPPAIKHAKHTFSGLIACANCGKHHTFEMGSNGKKRISSCDTRVYNDDFTTYKMCGNSGTVLENVEMVFYPTLEAIKTKLENYIDMIKQIQASGGKVGRTLETEKNIKLQQIEQMKKKRKKIQKYIEADDFYTEEEELEKVKEVYQLRLRIEELETEIKEMDEKDGESELEPVEKVIENINKFFEGKNDPNVSEKTLNTILSEFIFDIAYRRKNRWAESHIDVHLKDNMIQEIVNGSEDLYKIA